MALGQSLDKSSIALGESLSSADDVIHRIAELIVQNPLAASLGASKVERLLKEREALGSTGLGKGIAIPHCASDELTEFVVGVLTLERGVEFGSLDHKSADLFFFVMGPRESRNRHINLLSAISKFASHADLLAALRSERDPAAAYALLEQNVPYDNEAVGTEKVLFQIFAQNMDHFEEILNLLSSILPGTIAVLETRNAGAYLFRMPLFAAFWSDKAEQEGRVILAVADKPATNRIIRQIQEITGDPDTQSGVLVTVQNLSYAAGRLDF
jgi:PTS system nitrogen regulatory IIA component